ncbi:hypothetical protein BN1211_2017 [Cyberlindnera jadinii]|uniref:Uncharacterized protein n=1 Tax=Cyberlindnera jadinii (strain ATCC 18201 / CBS 1600 / BCRC 20928 / JCM 3617 / NBRC 0987 / NRRL Y-1542) TaxID=983966 RepID=A0A0H5C1R1_CYBJN|nr:hypothetical protein BN1211_2017 [Cyberlindnera jadinii]
MGYQNGEDSTPNKDGQRSLGGRRRFESPLSRTRTWDLANQSAASPFRRLISPSHSKVRRSSSSSVSLEKSHVAGAKASDDIVGWIHSMTSKVKTALQTEQEEEKQFYKQLQMDKQKFELHDEVHTEAFDRLKEFLDQKEKEKEEEEEEEDEEKAEDKNYGEEVHEIDDDGESDVEYEVEDEIIESHESDQLPDDSEEEMPDYSRLNSHSFDQDLSQYVEHIKDSDIEYDSDGNMILPQDAQFLDVSTDESGEKDELEQEALYDPASFVDDSKEYHITPQYKSAYSQNQSDPEDGEMYVNSQEEFYSEKFDLEDEHLEDEHLEYESGDYEDKEDIDLDEIVVEAKEAEELANEFMSSADELDTVRNGELSGLDVIASAALGQVFKQSDDQQIVTSNNDDGLDDVDIEMVEGEDNDSSDIHEHVTDNQKIHDDIQELDQDLQQVDNFAIGEPNSHETSDHDEDHQEALGKNEDYIENQNVKENYEEEQYYDSDDEPFVDPATSIFGRITQAELDIDGESDSKLDSRSDASTEILPEGTRQYISTEETVNSPRRFDTGSDENGDENDNKNGNENDNENGDDEDDEQDKQSDQREEDESYSESFVSFSVNPSDSQNHNSFSLADASDLFLKSVTPEPQVIPPKLKHVIEASVQSTDNDDKDNGETPNDSQTLDSVDGEQDFSTSELKDDDPMEDTPMLSPSELENQEESKTGLISALRKFTDQMFNAQDAVDSDFNSSMEDTQTPCVVPNSSEIEIGTEKGVGVTSRFLNAVEEFTDASVGEPSVQAEEDGQMVESQLEEVASVSLKSVADTIVAAEQFTNGLLGETTAEPVQIDEELQKSARHDLLNERGHDTAMGETGEKPINQFEESMHKTTEPIVQAAEQFSEALLEDPPAKTIDTIETMEHDASEKVHEVAEEMFDTALGESGDKLMENVKEFVEQKVEPVADAVVEFTDAVTGEPSKHAIETAEQMEHDIVDSIDETAEGFETAISNMGSNLTRQAEDFIEDKLEPAVHNIADAAEQFTDTLLNESSSELSNEVAGKFGSSEITRKAEKFIENKVKPVVENFVNAIEQFTETMTDEPPKEVVETIESSDIAKKTDAFIENSVVPLAKDIENAAEQFTNTMTDEPPKEVVDTIESSDIAKKTDAFIENSVVPLAKDIENAAEQFTNTMTDEPPKEVVASVESMEDKFEQSINNTATEMFETALGEQGESIAEHVDEAVKEIIKDTKEVIDDSIGSDMLAESTIQEIEIPQKPSLKDAVLKFVKPTVDPFSDTTTNTTSGSSTNSTPLKNSKTIAHVPIQPSGLRQTFSAGQLDSSNTGEESTSVLSESTSVQQAADVTSYDYNNEGENTLDYPISDEASDNQTLDNNQHQHVTDEEEQMPKKRMREEDPVAKETKTPYKRTKNSETGDSSGSKLGQVPDFKDHIIIKTRTGRILDAHTSEEITEAKMIDEREERIIEDIAHGELEASRVVSDIAEVADYIENHNSPQHSHHVEHKYDDVPVGTNALEEKQNVLTGAGDAVPNLLVEDTSVSHDEQTALETNDGFADISDTHSVAADDKDATTSLDVDDILKVDVGTRPRTRHSIRLAAGLEPKVTPTTSTRGRGRGRASSRGHTAARARGSTRAATVRGRITKPKSKRGTRRSKTG